MRYWRHPESSWWGVSTDEEDLSGVPCDEFDRDEFLEAVAYDAFQNAAQNDASTPEDDLECAAEMVESGVFATGDPSPEVLDEEGVPLDDVVRAVGRARQMRRDVQ